MNKLYSVHDHWTDINKKNDVDIESIDGVITEIKVNGEDYGGSFGEFKIANITWEGLPETFDDYTARNGFLMIKTEDGVEDYLDIYEFSEVLLQWDDEWYTSPKAVVTTKQPENVGDIAVWLQPYQYHSLGVVSGNAFEWNGGIIIYGDCTLSFIAQ